MTKPALKKAVIVVTPYGDKFTTCMRAVDVDGRVGMVTDHGLLYDEDAALEAAERWAKGIHERLKITVEVRVTEVVIKLPDWKDRDEDQSDQRLPRDV